MQICECSVVVFPAKYCLQPIVSVVSRSDNRGTLHRRDILLDPSDFQNHRFFVKRNEMSENGL